MKKKNRPAGGRQSQYARIEIAEHKDGWEIRRYVLLTRRGKKLLDVAIWIAEHLH